MLLALLLFLTQPAQAQTRAAAAPGAAPVAAAPMGWSLSGPESLSLKAPLLAPGMSSTLPSPSLQSLSLPDPAVRDPVTGVYGMNEAQSKEVVSILKEHYGDDMIDLAVIGSRAKGKASALKGFRPVGPHSDLDIVPLVKNDYGMRGPVPEELKARLRKLLGYSVEIHGVISFDGERFKDSVPFYGGGYETYQYFEQGEAVRLPLD
ncbi:MAG: nucleotidyltransferase domain-containing protein [Elusimicrobiota bacterium]